MKQEFMFSLLWIWFMCHQGLWKGEDTKCRNTQDKELTETFITQQSRIQSQEEPKDQKHKVPTKRSKVQIRKSGITKQKVETRGGNNTTAHTHTHTHSRGDEVQVKWGGETTGEWREEESNTQTTTRMLMLPLPTHDDLHVLYSLYL